MAAALLLGLLTSTGFAASPISAPLSGDATYRWPAAVTLEGQIYDAEGKSFSYAWLEAIPGGTEPYCSNTVNLIPEKTYTLPPCQIDGLEIGVHVFTLSVTDIREQRTILSDPITITLTEGPVPTLAPAANRSILRPANNKLVPVTIETMALDSTGKIPSLSAVVSCDEPVKITGQGKKSPAVWNEPVIDEKTGTIKCYLPAQRQGKGNGRVYTISIIATDVSGNETISDIKVLVPHDRGNKSKVK